MNLALITLLVTFWATYVCAFRLPRAHALGTRAHALGTRLHAKTPLVANGKRVEVEEGSSMIQACSKLGLKVPTSCKKGECGTCTVTCAGRKIRACIGKVPDAPKLKSLLEKGLVVTVDNLR